MDRREFLEVSVGAAAATGISVGAAQSSMPPVNDTGNDDRPMSMADIEAALMRRMRDAAEVAYRELQRMRELTEGEPDTSWISEMTVDVALFVLSDLDVAKVRAEVEGMGREMPAHAAMGINRESDYAWVRPAGTVERRINGQPEQLVKIPNASRLTRNIFEA